MRGNLDQKVAASSPPSPTTGNIARHAMNIPSDWHSWLNGRSADHKRMTPNRDADEAPERRQQIR
jgi:hypothetical protein